MGVLTAGNFLIGITFHGLQRPTAVLDRGAFLEVIFYKEWVKLTGPLRLYCKLGETLVCADTGLSCSLLVSPPN